MLAVLLGTAMSLISASPATAAPRNKSPLGVARQVFQAADPTAAYDALSAQDRAKFEVATQPVAVEVTATPIGVQPGGVIPMAYSGCWGMHFTGAAKALAGNTIYTFWQSTWVCASGGSVYDVWLEDVGGETSTPGWRIEKDPTTSTKNVGWEGRGKAQYYFVLGVGGWDVSHPTTCLQGRLNANGYDYSGLVGGSACDLAA